MDRPELREINRILDKHYNEFSELSIVNPKVSAEILALIPDIEEAKKQEGERIIALVKKEFHKELFTVLPKDNYKATIAELKDKVIKWNVFEQALKGEK